MAWSKLEQAVKCNKNVPYSKNNNASKPWNSLLSSCIGFQRRKTVSSATLMACKMRYCKIAEKENIEC